MKYIFKEKSSLEYQKGQFPIETIHLCWYDMKNGNECYDEDWISPRDFRANYLTYIDTEEDEGDSDRTRIFIHHKKGDIYELRLHKLSLEEWSECTNFYGGRDN